MFQAQSDSNAELEELETQLPVSDILLYRLLAEHSMQHPAEPQPAADPDTGQPASDTARYPTSARGGRPHVETLRSTLCYASCKCHLRCCCVQRGPAQLGACAGPSCLCESWLVRNMAVTLNPAS